MSEDRTYTVAARLTHEELRQLERLVKYSGLPSKSAVLVRLLDHGDVLLPEHRRSMLATDQGAQRVK